jgi:hypothetical protein
MFFVFSNMAIALFADGRQGLVTSSRRAVLLIFTILSLCVFRYVKTSVYRITVRTLILLDNCTYVN